MLAEDVLVPTLDDPLEVVGNEHVQCPATKHLTGSGRIENPLFDFSKECDFAHLRLFQMMTGIHRNADVIENRMARTTREQMFGEVTAHRARQSKIEILADQFLKLFAIDSLSDVTPHGPFLWLCSETSPSTLLGDSLTPRAALTIIPYRVLSGSIGPYRTLSPLSGHTKKPEEKIQGDFWMSVYDSKDLMDFKGAAREYDIPVMLLELSVDGGTLRAIEVDGQRRLLRADVENLVNRTVKRGYGNRLISRINPVGPRATPGLIPKS